MTELEEYQEHIRYTHNAFCRIVIRHASIDAARKLYSKWKREISLEYLSEEKFMPFAATDEYFAQPLSYPVLYLHGVTKLPSRKALQEEIQILTVQKNAGYNDYQEKRERCRQLQTVKGNIDQILRRDKPQRRKEQSHELRGIDPYPVTGVCGKNRSP